ncbi:penicillin acylase family protein [Neoroseomonas soli]|nr:penicillin acylase family protein [Neoroseomonas soli]
MLRLLLLLFLAGCASIDPRPVGVDRRIAALPAAGAAIERPVVIRWNRHMVPWVEAETDRDLFFALGLVQGHLRGAQIALMRLAARGRLSEVAGPFATEIDHALRILDFGRAAPAIRAAWPEETRRLMAAFVAGLNHATMRAEPPPEFALLGLAPEPYTEDDLLAIGRLAGTDVNWLGYLSILPARGTPGFARLWERTVAAGTSAPEAALPPDRRLALVRDILAGTSRAGSNTVAVAGRRSASGGALIGSDPHLALNLPNLWLAAGMRSPSFHAVGLMVPGLPFLGVGRNPEIGWGGTNMRAASSDLFDVSRLPPEQFRTETVRIRQRLWFTATREVRITPLGPVLTDASVLPRRPGDVIALRWVGHEPTDEITALLAAARARNGQEFRAAFDRFGVSAQNMLWAGRDGSIGQFYATTIPARREIPREDPVLDARDAAATAPWQRLLRTPDLPYVVNPREGFLASANNRPEPLGGRTPPVLGYFFSDSDRVARLREMLAAQPRATAQDIMAIQADTRSPRAGRLAAALVERLGGTPEAAPLIEALRGWDGDYRVDARAPVAFEVLLARLVPLLQPEERQGETGNRRSPESQWNFLTAFLLPDLDALPPGRRAAVLREASAAAARDFAALGTWGDMHRLRVSHWLFNLPVVGGAFAYGDHPVGGSRETPMKTSHGLVTQRHAASFGSMARHVSDMADPDANWFTLWGGQDGWLGSAAFADQVPLWLERRSIRIPLRRETVAAEFPRVTRLEPAR